MKRLLLHSCASIFALSLLVITLGMGGSPGYCGTWHYVNPNRLARPRETPSRIVLPHILDDAPASAIKAPPGFKVSVFADHLIHPRWMTVLPNGDVLCVESRVEWRVKHQAKRVILLRDTDGDGRADTKEIVADHLNLPFGIAYRNGYLYVANTGSVVRWPYAPGQVLPLPAPEVVIKGIPELGYNQHWTRNILFDPAGAHLYLTVGSIGNCDIEPPPRGTIVEYALSKGGLPLGGGHVLADGLRNPVGLAFNPKTNRLWATCVERDYEGDDLVPDFLTSIKRGGFYGWPQYYIGRHRDPHIPERLAVHRPVIVPDVLFEAHSTPLGLCFYGGRQFPAEYRGDAFVAFHGSTNRSRPTGYKVVRVRFDQRGKPKKGYEDFLTGWMVDRNSRSVYGRPAGLAIDRKGALLIADDGAKKIWRVTYSKGGLQANKTGKR